MPDLPNRTKHERRLSSATAGVLSAHRREWKRTGKLDAKGMREDFRGALAGILAIIYLDASDELFKTFKTKRLDRMDIFAGQWAKTYSKELSDQLVSTSLQRIVEARRHGGELPDHVFTRDRAEDIGITEVTRAATAGERRAKRSLEVALDLEIDTYWVTARDAVVCQTCQPLDGRLITSLPARFRNGPPAHPRCRCYQRYEART